MLLLLLACAPKDSSSDTASSVEDTAPTDSADTAPIDTADTAAPSSPTWYIACGAGDDDADGTTPETAWNTLAPLASRTFEPGDAIRLARGTTCAGSLTFAGSGTAEAPIVVGAYGSGPVPVIDGLGEDAALRLTDQGGVEVADLELENSSPYGVYVGASTGTVAHIRLTDLHVHDVPGEVTTKLSGLVVLVAEGSGPRLDDVVIDGVQAESTTQWAGILVYGSDYTLPAAERGAGITIRNSTVHDTYGDGIVVFAARDALLETNVAWRTGQQPTETIGTPNAIWTWACDTCTVQYNEAYENDSPGVDGGAFDIDYYNTDNVVQYNFGHDNSAYCVSIFGAAAAVTSGPIVRYNVCADNDREDEMGYQGEIFLYTWSRGTIAGARIYNNTILHRPTSGWPALVDWATKTGTNTYTNNLVMSTSDWLVDTLDDGLAADHDLWYTTADHGWFRIGDAWADGLSAWQDLGQDPAGVSADPLLLDPLWTSWPDVAALAPQAGSPAIDAGAPVDVATDYAGTPVDAAPDIGAFEWSGTSSRTASPPPTRRVPLDLAEPPGVGPGSARSLAARMRAHPEIDWVLVDTSGLRAEDARRRADDWGLAGVPIEPTRR